MELAWRTMTCVRYHLDLGQKRTTVSLDETVAAMLAYKLCGSPDDESAHATVREWLQEFVDTRKFKGRYRSPDLSAAVREHALMFLVDKKLSTKYWCWKHGD